MVQVKVHFVRHFLCYAEWWTNANPSSLCQNCSVAKCFKLGIKQRCLVTW